MRRMIWLHTESGKILVNPNRIELVFCIDESDHHKGSMIYFVGREVTMRVLDSIEEIDRLISVG